MLTISGVYSPLKTPMRFLIRAAALAACIFPLATVRSVGVKQDNGPVAIPTKVVGNQWMIKATVGGREGWYLLSTSSKTSILLPRAGQSGPDGRRQREAVSIGPINGDEVSFRIVSSPTLKPLGVDGVLGSDALASFNLAVDIDEAQVSTWVEQPSLYSERGWILLLPMIASATQHATTLSVDDVDKVPSGIPCAIGQSHGLAVVDTADPVARISSQALAATDTLTVVPGSSGSVAVDGVAIGELGPFFMVASGTTSDLPNAANREVASIPITSLPVRRLVLDGRTGTIISEELGSNGVEAVQLSRLLGIPLDIEQSLLYLRHEGALYGKDLLSYDGAQVVDIAGIPGGDIVSAIQGTSAERLAMLKRLATARLEGYKLDIHMGEKDYATTVKKPTS
jgi:hypothetical protein